MAFEPQRSIAGIMTAYGGKFPSAIGGLAQGYERGVQTRMLKDEAELRKRQLGQQQVEKMKDDVGRKALAVYMLPEQERILGWAEFRNSVITDYGTDPGEYSLENLNETLFESDIGAKVQLSEIEHQRSQGQFGKPFEAINAQGRRVFVERAPDGTMREVEGYTAPSPASLMDRPSSLQEWDAFNRMNQADQSRYLTMKRAMPTLNLGGTQVQLDPAGGGVAREYPVTPKPEQMPEFQAEQVAAQKHEENRQKWYSGESKLKQTLGSMQARTKLMEDTVTQAKGLINGYTTQYGAAVNSWPGSAQRSLRNLLDTIRANVGFAELGDMRAMSPTGGALGQVSEFENKMLQSVMGAIDQADDPKMLIATLDRIMQERNGSLSRMQQAYQMDATRYSQPYSKPVQQQPAQQQIQQPAQQSPEYTNYGPRAQPQSGGIKFLGFE